MTKDDIRKEEGSQGLKVKTRKHVKIRPSQIDKKQGNLKRFDIVGSVQIKATSKIVAISSVAEIAKVPQSNYAYAIHLCEQPA